MRKLMLSIIAFVTLGTGTALACQEFPQQHYHQQAVRSDKVQIQWGASWYAGTILDQRGAQYLVRFDGYSSAWDEWVGPDRLRFDLKIKELLQLMVFDSLKIVQSTNDQWCITKPNKNVMLDFKSLSPGYAVDIVAAFLEASGMRNYMIELGGEIRALGVNDKKQEWVIGINRPQEGANETEIELPLMISNKSIGY